MFELYSTYLKFGNVRENLMEKGVFLGVPKNHFFLGVAIMGRTELIYFFIFCDQGKGRILIKF
jgi:hypothetical protein